MFRSQWTLALLLVCCVQGISHTVPVMKNTESNIEKQKLSLLKIIFGSDILAEQKAVRPWDTSYDQTERKAEPINQSRKKRQISDDHGTGTDHSSVKEYSTSVGEETTTENTKLATSEVNEVSASSIPISQHVPDSVNNNTERVPFASSDIWTTSVTEKTFSANTSTSLYSTYSEALNSAGQTKTSGSPENSTDFLIDSNTGLPTVSSSNLSALDGNVTNNAGTQVDASVTSLWQRASVSMMSTNSTNLPEQATFLTSTAGGNATAGPVVDPVNDPDLNKSVTTANIKTTKEPDSSSTLVDHVPIITITKTLPTESSTWGRDCRTTSNPGKTETIVGQCLIAIAILAAVATIFIICTIVLATKLSASRQNYRVSHQNNTEMVCISTLLPDSDGVPKSKVKQKRMKTFTTNSDDSDGDDLTLNSFLPDH